LYQTETSSKNLEITLENNGFTKQEEYHQPINLEKPIKTSNNELKIKRRGK